MDLYAAIRELHNEKRKIDLAIAALEAKQGKVWKSASPKRRGRKSMGRAERAEVSKRMRAYWAARRGGANESKIGRSTTTEIPAHIPQGELRA